MIFVLYLSAFSIGYNDKILVSKSLVSYFSKKFCVKFVQLFFAGRYNRFFKIYLLTI